MGLAAGRSGADHSHPVAAPVVYFAVAGVVASKDALDSIRCCCCRYRKYGVLDYVVPLLDIQQTYLAVDRYYYADGVAADRGIRRAGSGCGACDLGLFLRDNCVAGVGCGSAAPFESIHQTSTGATCAII
jgi:hypothetical protein